MIFSASTAALQFAPFPMCTSPWAVIFPSKLPKMRADFSKNISPLIVVSAPMTVISGELFACVVGICDIFVSFPIPMEWRAFARSWWARRSWAHRWLVYLGFPDW